MMSRNKTRSAAATAAGLVVLATLTGCGRKESVASKSAAAFEEAQKKGETFGGEGHAHGGHSASGHGAAAAPATDGMQHEAGHEGMDHAGHDTAAGGSPVDHSAMGHGAGAHAGGHAPRRSGSTQPEAAGAGHESHAGHGAPAAQAPAGDSRPGGHAGHQAPQGGTSARAVEELPEEPAGILRPDPLDAPAPTSVIDAQRSAEMNEAMSGGHGGHGGHGAGNYRQIDAGRGPGAHEGSEPQTPGAGPQHHDHGGAAAAETTLYVCPMHPEVTSQSPGTCPKCGMNLVERRKE